MREALIRALQVEFEPRIWVGEGLVPESLPGLAVAQTKVDQKPQGSGRVLRTYHYRIAYHPDPQVELLWENLALHQQGIIDCLARIVSAEGVAVASKLCCFVRESILLCRAEFPVQLRWESARPAAMQELDVTENYKEE